MLRQFGAGRDAGNAHETRPGDMEHIIEAWRADGRVPLQCPITRLPGERASVLADGFPW